MLINTDKAPVARYIMLHQTHKYIHVTGSRKSLERITLTRKLKVRSDFTTNGSQASFGLRHGFSYSVDGIQRLCFFVCFCFGIQFLYFGWLLCGCDSTLSWKHLKCWHGAYIPNWTKWDQMGALKRLETDNCCIRKILHTALNEQNQQQFGNFERNFSIVQFRDKLKFSDTLCRYPIL